MAWLALGEKRIALGPPVKISGATTCVHTSDTGRVARISPSNEQHPLEVALKHLRMPLGQ